MIRAALGFRAHSGWAAVVVVAGPARAPAAIERRRIELADPKIPGSRQPYHEAEGKDLERAEAIVEGCARGARLLAGQALGAMIDELKANGHEVVGAGLLLASGRPLTTLAETLASHARIHTADGELFRDALTHASGEHGLTMIRVKERELFASAAAALRVPVPELQRRIGEMGRPLGPPWRQDEKLAALVAWLTLTSPPRP